MRTSTRQDWLAAAALLAGTAACYAVPPAATGHSAARAVTAMAIGALIALSVARAPFTFAAHVRTAFVLLVTLSLWYVATRLWATDPAGSMVESSRVSAFVLMAWAAHTAVVGTWARRALLAGVAAAALFVAAPPMWHLLQHGAPTERIQGELGYWNASSIVALCLVPIAVALAGVGRRSLIVLAALMLPVAAVTAVATASRGALVALVVALLFQALLDPDYRGGLPRALVAAVSVGLVVAGLAIDGMPEVVSIVAPVLVAVGGFGLIRRRRTRREAPPALEAVPPVDDEPLRRRRPSGVQLVGALIVVALAALLITLVVSANDEALPKRQTASTNDDVSRLATTDDSRRFAWWHEGVDIWQRAPLWGKGGGAFDAYHVDRPADEADHVHSMPLEVLLETGIIGALLLLVATVALLRVLRRGRRSTERALGGAIAALLLSQALIDWTLSLPQVIVLLALAGPLALQPPPEPEEHAAVSAVEPVWWQLSMLVSLAAATMVAFVPMLAALLADQAAQQFDEGKPVKASSLAEQSLQLVPSLDTLTVQVISLQSAGRDAEAARVLRDNEPVWSHSLSGLTFAQDVLKDDPKYGPKIADRIATLQREQAEPVKS